MGFQRWSRPASSLTGGKTEAPGGEKTRPRSLRRRARPSLPVSQFRVLASVDTPPSSGWPASNVSMQGTRGAGPVPWAALLDRRHPSSTFPCRPIRAREYKSWRCQGEGCEVARTRFGSSQVAEEALARARAGAETRTCHRGHLHSPGTLQASRLSLTLL